MTATRQFPRGAAAVKAELCDSFAQAVGPLLDWAGTDARSVYEAERRTWTALLPVLAMVVAAVFASMSRGCTERSLAARGLSLADVKLRLDQSYWLTVMTTFGRVRFPLFAWRNDPEWSDTMVPARSELFQLHPKIRSSPLCVEWESALASDHPFRKATNALGFFTHGAVDLEDTTVERHAILAGASIPRDFMYSTPAAIRKALLEQATRDKDTGRPIIYASTDAHALWRYTDETWQPSWKMANGTRLWCIDKVTGRIIHLGGEFILGDCQEVEDAFRRLQKQGILPRDGNYGDDVVAQIAFITDGAGWIAERVFPLFPGAVLVLDIFHVLEKVCEIAKAAYPRSKTKQRRIQRAGANALGVRSRRSSKRAAKRSAPKKKNGAAEKRAERRAAEAKSAANASGSGAELLESLREARPADLDAVHGKAYDGGVGYVENNVERMHYGQARRRGIQVGSGAMESMHRTGSQARTKLAGCTWTVAALQAILNLRMLALSGRWAEYWARPDLASRVVGRLAA